MHTNLNTSSIIIHTYMYIGEFCSHDDLTHNLIRMYMSHMCSYTFASTVRELRVSGDCSRVDHSKGFKTSECFRHSHTCQESTCFPCQVYRNDTTAEASNVCTVWSGTSLMQIPENPHEWFNILVINFGKRP